MIILLFFRNVLASALKTYSGDEFGDVFGSHVTADTRTVVFVENTVSKKKHDLYRVS